MPYWTGADGLGMIDCYRAGGSGGAIMKTIRGDALALEPRFAPMVERLDAVPAARKDARLASSVIKESVRLRLRDLPTSRIQG